MVAAKQPMKLASLEGQFQTETGAPFRIGGIPVPDKRETKYAIEIPYSLSLLSFHTPNALIKGLDQEPQSDWPNVRMVHICFQIMVGCGSLLSLFALLAGWLTWKKPPLINHKSFLKPLVLFTPLAFVPLEPGSLMPALGLHPCPLY